MKAILSSFLSCRAGRWLVRSLLALARILAGSDRRLLRLMVVSFRRRLPLAGGMLDHYLAGSGCRVLTDASALTRDPGFLARLADQVDPDASAGRFDVPQWHLDSLDLRCALGSFAVQWRRQSAGIALYCEGDYAWRPEDATRPTLLLHRAAARAPGAAAFRWEARVDGLAVPRRGTWLPSDRAYM